MKQKYIELLEMFLVGIDNIDNETPWSEYEPEWWNDMMNLRKKAYNSIVKYKPEKTK